MRSRLGILFLGLAAALAPAQASPESARAAIEFLRRHMPAGDVGVVTPEFLAAEVQLALAARAATPWGAQLTDAMFHNYVVPYAQANETRENWRADFQRRFLPRVADCQTPGEAALVLNRVVFDELNVHYSTKRRRADQSPSESIAQGMASCTGLSIVLADACRACCVPARLVSVAWPHKRGNHTWVEVWDGERWRFCGADEPDPKGLDRAWFVGDASKCAGAQRKNRIWTVSFARTGERFRVGWGRDIELWGIDVTARYTKQTQGGGGGDEALAAQLDRFYAATPEARAKFAFDRNLDAELVTKAGDARLRRLVFEAWRRSERPKLDTDHGQRVVRAGGKESPFTVKQVGQRPATGWPLVIAMHGGGGVPKKFNDSQWRHMQIYYRDQPQASGYLYCALRAPTDEWNGFYTDYFYPVLEKLIRQFVVCDGVDPDRVIAIGYSHGGYGAFALGPKLPHRFAAVHASAAAPTDGQTLPDGLHSLRFSFMVGGKDTAYGRRSRCEAFAKALTRLQRARPELYPTEFTLVEGNGHTGLPDRDLLQELVPLRRNPVPATLYWRPTDGVVCDHYWLHNSEPRRDQRLHAAINGQRVDYHLGGATAVEAWLDARHVDLTGAVTFRDVGEGWQLSGLDPKLEEQREPPFEVSPSPSLRTLATTMAERGDPRLAASWIVELR